MSTKKIILNELRGIVKQIIKENVNVNVEERVKRIFDYIQKNPGEKNRILSELHKIKDGLDENGEWVGNTDTDYYDLWVYHYKGFKSNDMEKLILGIYKKLFGSLQKTNK